MWRAAATLCALTASPAAAEVDRFEVGTFLKITAAYDEKANRFHTDVAKGERPACFKVLKVTEDTIDLSLVSGSYLPWWTDTAFEAGTYTDTWFNSDSYKNNNPGAAPLSHLKRLFSAVPSCADQPAGS